MIIANNNPFYDKRDHGLYRLDCSGGLYEVFKHKTKKCKVAIPETISIVAGSIFDS